MKNTLFRQEIFDMAFCKYCIYFQDDKTTLRLKFLSKRNYLEIQQIFTSSITNANTFLGTGTSAKLVDNDERLIISILYDSKT